MVADDFQHADGLAEDEDVGAFFGEWLEALEDAVDSA